MTFTDVGFSVIRNALIGGASSNPDVGVCGTGSNIAWYTDTALGSKMLSTQHPWSSVTSAQNSVIAFEHILLSGDAIGSTVREFGAYSQTGSYLFARDSIVDIVLDGSVQIQNTMTVYIQ